MASETAIIGGLGIIAGLMGYFAINMSDSENHINQKIAVFLALFSFVFVLIIMMVVYSITVTNASYLSNIILGAFKVMIAITTLLVGFLSLGILFFILKLFYDMVLKMFGKQKREENDE